MLASKAIWAASNPPASARCAAAPPRAPARWRWPWRPHSSSTHRSKKWGSRSACARGGTVASTSRSAAGQLGDARRPCGRWCGGHGRRLLVEGAGQPEAALEVVEAALGAGLVALVEDEGVGHLDDPGLEELDLVAAEGLEDEVHPVGQVADVGLALADADRLDDRRSGTAGSAGGTPGSSTATGRPARWPTPGCGRTGGARRGAARIRVRSPRRAPPEMWLDGSMASTAIDEVGVGAEHLLGQPGDERATCPTRACR